MQRQRRKLSGINLWCAGSPKKLPGSNDANNYYIIHKEDGWRGATRADFIFIPLSYACDANTRAAAHAEIVFQRYLADYLGLDLHRRALHLISNSAIRRTIRLFLTVSTLLYFAGNYSLSLFPFLPAEHVDAIWPLKLWSFPSVRRVSCNNYIYRRYKCTVYSFYRKLISLEHKESTLCR